MGLRVFCQHLDAVDEHVVGLPVVLFLHGAQLFELLEEVLLQVALPHYVVVVRLILDGNFLPLQEPLCRLVREGWGSLPG